MVDRPFRAIDHSSALQATPATCSGGCIMKISRRDALTASTTGAMMAITGSDRVTDALSQPVGAKKDFDVVIVGGGSAGAVLAARLSADAQRRVLLLEAGPNFAPGAYPKVLTDANIVAAPAFDWRYHTDDVDDRLGHDIPVPRGRVIGGSSAVNGTVGMRARPADFARWAKRGIEGWSWEEVLAAYKAMENTPTGDDFWHGRSGPLPIRQRTAEENTPSMRAFVAASESIGLAHVSDFNGAIQHGVGPYPLNVVDGVRVNTGTAYLTVAVRARPNLTIRGDAEVDRVVIDGIRAVGVNLVNGEVVSAGEVILAAGAFGSPAILMRSGVGPSDHLSKLGIRTIASLPVGDRLQDHPFFYNVYALKRAVRAMNPARARSSGRARRVRRLTISTCTSRARISSIRWRARPAAQLCSPRRSPCRSRSAGCACRALIRARRPTSTTTSSTIRTISTGWWRQCGCLGRSVGPRRSRT
jgi:choline dehydrogenase